LIRKTMAFRNRADAGRQLASLLGEFARRPDVLVLGLPRGGVPVAAEVAAKLGAPLDVFLVRKLGVPGHVELAMGAIAEGGIMVVSSDVVSQLEIPRAAIDVVAARERLELDRRDVLYRSGRARPAVKSRTIILIDDGLATGATMEAAIMALREQQPASVVVAVPVGSIEACARLKGVADRVVCALTPASFLAVGQWYEDFDQTDDAEVSALLASAARSAPAWGAS
jgi:putative phosphoribosyl transferase